jgi:hypothetical protein
MLRERSASIRKPDFGHSQSRATDSLTRARAPVIACSTSGESNGCADSLP